MELFEAIKQRASEREYQDKTVPDELLVKIVDAGRRAPTARGVEPWRFVIVQEKKTLKEIASFAENGAFIKNAAAVVAVFCQDTKYYLEDGCAATENILLAATALGLGACWIAGDKKEYAPKIAQLLNAGQELKLVSIVAIGWPKQTSRQKKKLTVDQVLFREKI